MYNIPSLSRSRRLQEHYVLNLFSEETEKPAGSDLSRPPASYEECYHMLWGHPGLRLSNLIIET